MGLPGTKVVILNGALGASSGSDYGIPGLIVSGIAVAQKIDLLEPKQIFSLNEAKDLGLNEAYDTDNSLQVYRQIKEFYDEAGSGQELWIMLVSQTVTMADVVDKTEDTYAKKLLIAAQNKIRLLAVSRVPDGTYVPTITEGLDDDVFSAMNNAQLLGEELAADNKPIRTLLEGRAFDDTPANLKDLKTESNNRVAIMIGGSKNDGSCSIGTLLGRLAADPLRRNPGRVLSGSLALQQAFVGSLDVDTSENQIGAIHDKGYISLRRHDGKAGYFFTDAPTATANTDDYSTLPPARVIDAAALIAFRTFDEFVLDEVEVDDNGYLSAAIVKSWESEIETAVLNEIGAEMSNFEPFINPRQNVLSVSDIAVQLEVTPVGYARSFTVELGFKNPFN